MRTPLSLSKVLATVLALAVSLPAVALAQSGSWKPAGASAGKGVENAPPSGSWKPATKGVDRLKERGDEVRKGTLKWYGESPNLQVIEGMIENLVLEKLPFAGEAASALKEAPESVKAGLTVWLQRKKNDAATAEDFDRMDRYDAFLGCLYGDCTALNALQQGGTHKAASGQHTGQPEQLKIRSAILQVAEIQEGESTQLIVTVQSMIGGDVTVELQSGGTAIGPVRYTVKTTPGGTVSLKFDQFFASAGNYRLLVLARDARSDDSARAYLVVTAKSKLDGHYTGTMVLDMRQGDKRVPQKMKLDIAVNSGNVSGSAQFEDTKPEYRSRITSTIDGKVDDKGNLSATWSYVYKISEAGAVYQYTITAPLNGIIKDDAISGAFACESKSSHNDTAERLLQAERARGRTTTSGLPNMSLDQGANNIAVVLMAHAYKDAPGRFAAKRVK